MATISERIDDAAGFGMVTLDDDNPTSAHIYLPNRFAKALRQQERRKSTASARRQYETMLEAQARSRKTTDTGRLFDDLGWAQGGHATGIGLRKPWGSLSFATLRSLADISWIDRLIINARKAQARRYAQVCEAPGEQLGFRCVHRQYKNSDIDTDTPDIRRRCQEMNDRLKAVTRPIHKNFADVLENMIEDELVIDRRVFIKPKGRDGSIVSYHMIDGSTIRPRLEVLGQWMIAHNVRDPEVAERRMQRELLLNPPFDLRTGQRRVVNFMSAAYVQVFREQVVDAWRDEDIFVGLAHPSIRVNHWGYGTSALEHSWGLSATFMRAMRYNQNLFDVNFPDAILLIPGGYDQEGLGAFRRQVFDYDDAEATTRLPIVSGVDIDGDEFRPELLKLRDTPKDMLFTELIRFICNLKCAAYGMHPSEINVMPDGQGGAIVNVDQSKGDEIADATERGFHSLMTGQADTFTEALILPDHDDLMYIVEGLDDEGEQATAARVESMATQSTFNELRALRNQKPLPKGVPTDPGDFVANPEYLSIVQLMQQQAQAESQQSMGNYEQGNFGEPGGGAGDQPGGGGPPPGGAPGQPGAPGGGDGPGAPGAGSQSTGGGGATPSAGVAPGGRPVAPGQAAGTNRPPPPGRGGGGKPNPFMRSIEIAPDARSRWEALIDDEDE